MSSFRGIWVALVTPFRNGAVDYPALQGLVGQLLEQGVAGLVVCGTTGEAAALSHDEQLEVLDAVLQWAPSQQVIMGLAGNNQRELLAFLQAVQRRPVAGVLVPAPYYVRPSQAGLESLVLYDIPYRTGVRIERETLRRIVRHPNIVAIKDCGGDPETIMALIADGQVSVLTGEDLQIFTNLCLGGAGAISASSHVRADLYVTLFQQMEEGDVTSARQTFYRLLPWMQAAFAEPNPAAIKGALALLGMIGDEVREPMQACTPATRERLRKVLADLA